jgi:hypothetical protein
MEEKQEDLEKKKLKIRGNQWFGKDSPTKY